MPVLVANAAFFANASLLRAKGRKNHFPSSCVALIFEIEKWQASFDVSLKIKNRQE